MRTRIFQMQKLLMPVLALLISTSAFAEDETLKVDRKTKNRLNRIWKTQSPVEGFTPVEMFEAMDSGEIKVLIKTKDAANANLMVTNNSDKPLSITMPAAFAAVPALAQGLGGLGGGGGGLGGGGGGLGGGGGFGGGGQNQGVGGGLGGGGGGGGFGGGGGGFGGGGQGGGGGVFSIPPGRTGKISVKTICLEHGKADPQPRIDYVVKPISVLSNDAKVLEVCRMLANDEITQPVAQAAGWNIANKLSWEAMLTKNRVELSTGYYERFFNRGQLELAYKVVEVAGQRAEMRQVSEKKESRKSNKRKTTERLPAGS